MCVCVCVCVFQTILHHLIEPTFLLCKQSAVLYLRPLLATVIIALGVVPPGTTGIIGNPLAVWTTLPQHKAIPD